MLLLKLPVPEVVAVATKPLGVDKLLNVLSIDTCPVLPTLNILDPKPLDALALTASRLVPIVVLASWILSVPYEDDNNICGVVELEPDVL